MMATNVLHMNAGSGVNSYANNSTPQKLVISMVKTSLEDTIKDMFSDNIPKCLKIADLGCSSGPNTLFFVANVVDMVNDLCQRNCWIVPEFQVSLNDLPENDFNNIFKLLPLFNDAVKAEKGGKFGPCFISATPGSFYERLFPRKSQHLFHSSCCIHWLSKVPQGIENNKGDIYLSKRSPPEVFEAYLKQFQSDFKTFLGLRALEMVDDARMVLTFASRSIPDPYSKDACDHYELVAKSLLEMVKEGIVEEADLFSFNVPTYMPYKEEVKRIIQDEGSFNLEKIDTFKMNWDANENDVGVFNKFESAKLAAKCIRAYMEPMLASHFGESIIEDLFLRFVNHVAEYLSKEKGHYFNIVISLSKKKNL